MQKVLLDYTGSDTSFGMAVEAALEVLGQKTLRPGHSAVPGELIREAVRRDIEEADAVIFIVSEESLTNEWLLTGISFAKAHNDEKGRRAMRVRPRGRPATRWAGREDAAPAPP
jgi:hypothetical protein